MDRPLRVAVSQRVLPAWRVPAFRALSQRPGIQLTVFYGRGPESQMDGTSTRELDARRLPTIGVRYRHGSVDRYRVLHPTLLWQLMRGRYDVVIVEPSPNLPNDVLCLIYSSVYRKPLVWYETGGGRNSPSVARRFLEPFVRVLIRRAASAVTYYEAAVPYLLKAGVPRDRIFVALNTLDIDALRADATALEPRVTDTSASLGVEGRRVIAFVGALERRKRVDTLVVAFAALQALRSDLALIIVGDGPDRQRLERIVSVNKLKDVHFVGRQERDATLYLLLSAVAVLPGDGGLAVNHALACGVPVVATEGAMDDTGGVHEFIDSGVNGLVLPKGVGPVDLALAIDSIIGNDDILATMTHAASASATRFSLDNMVDGVHRAICSAASSLDPDKA